MTMFLVVVVLVVAAPLIALVAIMKVTRLERRLSEIEHELLRQVGREPGRSTDPASTLPPRPATEHEPGASDPDRH